MTNASSSLTNSRRRRSHIDGQWMVGKLGVGKAPDHSERAVPAGAGEEVLSQIDKVREERVYGTSRQILGRGAVGPVDQERLADDVIAGHEAPVAAVKGVVAVVAHREIVPRRHDCLPV